MDISADEVDILKQQAERFNIPHVFLPPFWLKRVCRDKKDIQLGTLAGFPMGYQMTETKQEEIKLALRDGATEVGVTLNHGAFRTRMPWTKIELAKCAHQLHDQHACFYVLLNVTLLNHDELIRAARMAKDTGADLIFGWSSTGEDLPLIDKMNELRQYFRNHAELGLCLSHRGSLGSIALNQFSRLALFH